MTLFMALEKGTDRRLRQSLIQSEVEPVVDTEYLHTDDTWDTEPDESEFKYDPLSKAFLPIVPPVYARTVLSKREFRNRIGEACRRAIIALRRSTDPNLAVIRDTLEDMKETLDGVPNVDLENKDTIKGINGLVQLGQMGHIPFTAADGVRVLTPSTVEQED